MDFEQKRRRAFLDETNDDDGTPEGVDLADAVEEFLGDLARERKPSTTRFYTERFSVFVPWATRRGITRVEQITAKLLKSYRNERLDGKVQATTKDGIDYVRPAASKTTVHGDENAVKRLMAYCVEMEMIPRNNLRHYTAVPCDQKERRPAENWELDKIVKVIDNYRRATPDHKGARVAERHFVRSRDKLVILTQIETGARCGEILALTFKDVDTNEHYIRLDKSGMADTRKCGGALDAPVSETWCAAFRDYIRLLSNREPDAFVFPTTEGGFLCSRAWTRRFDKYRKAAGVDGITSHCIRHKYGTDQAEENGILAAGRLLGQKSLQSTQRYTRKAGTELKWLQEKHASVSPLESFAKATGRTPSVKERAYRK